MLMIPLPIIVHYWTVALREMSTHLVLSLPDVMNEVISVINHGSVKSVLCHSRILYILQ